MVKEPEVAPAEVDETADADPATEIESAEIGSADDAENEAARLDAYDVNEDGRISPIEDVQALLGVADARLAELSEEPGLKGKIAEAAHKIVDQLDND